MSVQCTKCYWYVVVLFASPAVANVRCEELRGNK